MRPPAQRLWLLNRFYWPDEQATSQLLTDLAEGLAAKGWECRVICSQPLKRDRPDQETRHGVAIHRLFTLNAGRLHVLFRPLDFALYLLGVWWVLARQGRRGDQVIAKTDPPFLGTAAWLACALRKMRLMHWVQDIYPEVAMALTPNSSLRRLLALLRYPRDLAWRKATGCVTLGSDMAELIHRAGVDLSKLHQIRNWAPKGLEPVPLPLRDAQRKTWGLEAAFIVLYSGNLGRVHELEPILEIAELLREDPVVHFVFSGNGARKRALEQTARDRGLRTVRFYPPQARAGLGSLLSAGDLHLVTLKEGCETVVFPSKFHGILALEKPVLYVGPVHCELAEWVRREGLGGAYARTQTAEAAAFIHKLSREPKLAAHCAAAAKRNHEASGGAGAAIEAWQKLLTAHTEKELR